MDRRFISEKKIKSNPPKTTKNQTPQTSLWTKSIEICLPAKLSKILFALSIPQAVAEDRVLCTTLHTEDGIHLTMPGAYWAKCSFAEKGLGVLVDSTLNLCQ